MADTDYTLPLDLPFAVQLGERYWLEVAGEHQRERQLDLLAAAAQRVWPGLVASLDGTGGLVANLRVWENLILPAWYHHAEPLGLLEAELLQLFDEVGINDDEAAKLCQGLPAALAREHKRELALLRAALLKPYCLIVDGDWISFLSYGRGLACRALFERIAQSAVTFVAAAYPPAEAGYRRLVLDEAGQLIVSGEHETA
ncbi:hypothetical protein [Chitinolyticbacter meiyuanensis]|uniref:hypothetical protein n=1 Tax=Chitinolyticbacter meiyuanensis TaxID=682798 RepID=UPI0011E595C8|nr:hypothetical protein [Chitinolyticbacter meiyuanensis]